MKKLLLTGALLALTASLASAQPVIRLAWNECGGTAGATTDDGWACNNSLASNNKFAVSSFFAPAVAPQVVGLTTVIKLATASPALPDWWKNGPADCHNGYGVDPASAIGFSNCLAPESGQTSTGYLWLNNDGGANRATVVSDLAWQFPVALTAGAHYYAQVHTIKAVRTTGTGACAGCTVPACLVLDEVQVFQQVGAPGGDVISLRNPAGQEAFATWQGGTGVAGGCPGATPTRRATWGEIKTLYR